MTPYSLPLIARIFLVLLLTTTLSTAYGDGSSAQPGFDATPLELQVGFNGHSRLGSWCPVFFKPEAGSKFSRFEIDAVDADGFPVTCRGKTIQRSDGWVECIMQTGRMHPECRLRLSSDNGGTATREFRLNDSSASRTIHASTEGITVVIEPGQSIASTLKAQQSATISSSETTVVSVTESAQLPYSWLAWQSVEKLIIASSAIELLDSMSQEQWLAIRTWVERGGQLILAVGPDQREIISENGPLHVFLPGSGAEFTEIDSSSRIEFFANANEQLIARDADPIGICHVQSIDGRIDLTQNNLPLVISSAFGFGKLTFVAFDISSNRLVSWNGYAGLLRQIINPVDGSEVTSSRSGGSGKGNRVSHVGYTDLAGQLRLTLDRFTSVSFVSFASIASLIGLFILCVGPGDYYLLRKLFGRMELTWLTFPVISALFCFGAFSLAKSVRPASIKLNQLEIVDIDQASGQAQSNIWTHYYSPIGGTCSIDLPDSCQLADSIEQRIISWQGLPGDGLGGMNTRTVNSLTGKPYFQVIESDRDQSKLNMRIEEQPLRVSSTRALFGQWWSKSSFQLDSHLKLNRRTRHIEGTFSNPFDQPLKDCRLLFDQYVYRLPERLEPGEEIDILIDDLKEQTTRSYLNRRSKDDENVNRARKIPWNPTGTGIDRLAEIMMFYSAAGGQEYTGLTHAYQPFSDLTEHLNRSKAILVGKVDTIITPLQIDGKSADDSYDTISTYVRLIFPVESN